MALLFFFFIFCYSFFFRPLSSLISFIFLLLLLFLSIQTNKCLHSCSFLFCVSMRYSFASLSFSLRVVVFYVTLDFYLLFFLNFLNFSFLFFQLVKFKTNDKETWTMIVYGICVCVVTFSVVVIIYDVAVSIHQSSAMTETKIKWEKP